MQEVVDAFVNARSTVLHMARTAQEAEAEAVGQPALKKRKVESSEVDGEAVVPDLAGEGRRTRSQSKRAGSQATVEVVEDSQDDECIPGRWSTCIVLYLPNIYQMTGLSRAPSVTEG